MRRAQCPYCYQFTYIEEKTWDEQLWTKVPEGLIKVGLVEVAHLAAGRLGALAVGGAFLAEQAIKYNNGRKVRCGNPACRNEFAA